MSKKWVFLSVIVLIFIGVSYSVKQIESKKCSIMARQGESIPAYCETYGYTQGKLIDTDADGNKTYVFSVDNYENGSKFVWWEAVYVKPLQVDKYYAKALIIRAVFDCKNSYQARDIAFVLDDGDLSGPFPFNKGNEGWVKIDGDSTTSGKIQAYACSQK